MTVDIPGPILLSGGGSLPAAQVYLEQWGQPLDRAEAPLVLICHALTGDARAYRPEDGHGPRGWWQGLVGAGRLFDPARARLVCMAVLGGCAGTTGPASVDPATGRAYGLAFPVVTVRDMVRLQAAALDRLGVDRVDLVIGGSLGGMQALEWAETYPDRVGLAVVIGATDRMPGHALALNAVQREVICQDPGFDPGRPKATRGLGVARALAMVSYRGTGHMDRQFGRRPSQGLSGTAEAVPVHRELTAVDDYLRHQAAAIRRRFDSHSYLYLMRAMDLHDIARNRDALPTSGPPVLFVGISSDILFPAAAVRQSARRRRARGLPTAYLPLRSPFGHDAFLVDTDRLAAILRPTVERALNGAKVEGGPAWTGTRAGRRRFGRLRPDGRSISPA